MTSIGLGIKKGRSALTLLGEHRRQVKLGILEYHPAFSYHVISLNIDVEGETFIKIRWTGFEFPVRIARAMYTTTDRKSCCFEMEGSDHDLPVSAASIRPYEYSKVDSKGQEIRLLTLLPLDSCHNVHLRT